MNKRKTYTAELIVTGYILGGWGWGVCQTLVRFETRVCFKTEDMTNQKNLGTDVK